MADRPTYEGEERERGKKKEYGKMAFNERERLSFNRLTSKLAFFRSFRDEGTGKLTNLFDC